MCVPVFVQDGLILHIPALFVTFAILIWQMFLSEMTQNEIKVHIVLL